MSDVDANKAAVRRYFDQVWLHGNVDFGNELFVPGSLLAGADQTNARAMQEAFSDIRVEIDDLIAEQDKVAARVTFTATHSGPIFGFPPTGRQAVLSVLYLFTFANGRIRTVIGESNMLGLLVNLGLIAPPGMQAD
jgi:predicted ester cyclase